MPQLWAHVKTGGVLLLNQTPHRFFPFESHTTGVPLINYLPDSATLWAARKFCKRVQPDETWTSLLRRGIRGGTVPEILRILGGKKCVQVLQPSAEVGDRIDLWLGTLSTRHALVKRSIWLSLKIIKWLTGRQITPTLSLALRKVG